MNKISIFWLLKTFFPVQKDDSLMAWFDFCVIKEDGICPIKSIPALLILGSLETDSSDWDKGWIIMDRFWCGLRWSCMIYASGVVNFQ